MDKLPVDSIVVNRTASEHWRLGTDELVVLATGDQTSGAIFAVEITMPPGGGPPVMHRHAPSEIYYVLEGEFAFYVGDHDGRVRRATAGAGEAIPLDGGTPHAVRNETEADAVALVVHSPAAVMEGFSRAAAAQAAIAPPTMEQVLELAAAHGVELLGPIPAATR